MRSCRAGRWRWQQRTSISSRRPRKEVIETAAAECSTTPRALHKDVEKELVRRLHQDGYFYTRNAAQTVADLLGISRAGVYAYTK